MLVDKLLALDSESLPQSKKWLTIDYLMEMLLLQAEGYAVLLNVYKAKGMDTKPQEEKMKEDFNKQVGVSIPSTDPLSYVFGVVLCTNEYFGIAQFADAHELLADDGKVIVGLQIYAKGNRVALQIAQATPEFTKMEEKLSTADWLPSPGWGEDYFEYGYADTNENVLPPGLVMTGAAFYQKGNHMALKLQGTPFDPITGKLTGPPAPWQYVTPDFGPNYIKTSNMYYDSRQVIPSTLSCLNGAALCIDLSDIEGYIN